ncbi:MAG: MerR family transcriptional regulator [Burkholderiales bacterium RIFCSPHIGHO2_12_FULL_61_11]|nr:MAG: MerR family transcriptional regulator [Burkholderiales bacterium RIFCSPHIGHO2_12_FULL_61_11]
MTPNYTLALLPGFILEEETELTLDEVCRACDVPADLIVELVNEGVLIPDGNTPEQWRFTGAQLHRAQVALRLQSDLDVNLAGAALALELLDELEALRARLQGLDTDMR